MIRAPKSILVSGANGVVGQPLVKRLVDAELCFGSISRSRGERNIQWDLEVEPSKEVMQKISRFDCLIHCAPIWLLPCRLATFKKAGITRVIAFSSTSVISKRESLNIVEQELVERLSNAEKELLMFCRSEGVSVTILRPTMIYGYGRDQNVSHIAGLIKKFGFMVLVGKAQGLRQPVHADDLVDACFSLLDPPVGLRDVYNLSGGEVLSYRAMVERIFDGLQAKTRIVSLPLGTFRFLLWLASKFSNFDYTPDMANRMSQDLSYSNQPAVEDFDFSPQTFLTNPRRDLA